MPKQQYPSEKLDQYMLRLPDGMRDRIKASAEANNRSMNAEIVATLSEKYPDPVSPELEELFERAMKADPEGVRQFLKALLEEDIHSGKISEGDIRDGLIPGVRFHEDRFDHLVPIQDLTLRKPKS